jgi:hypothetical protein
LEQAAILELTRARSALVAEMNAVKGCINFYLISA